MSHQAHPGHPFSGGVFGFPGGEFVVGIDVQALIEKQRAVVENLPTHDCPIVFGGERVEVRLTKLHGGEWSDLVGAHPPRTANESDRFAGFDQNSLPGAYPVGSILFAGEPVDAEQWSEIYGMLDSVARNTLVMGIYKLNLLDPMNQLVALGKVGSGGLSGSPANRESRRVASKGGSQRKSRATSTTKKAD